MPMNELERDTVISAAALARFIVQEVKPRLDMLNVDYDAAGGVKETLTQQDLDDESSLSGITKAQVDDALYVLTNGIKGAIDTSFPQLQKLASRGELNNTFQPF